MTDINIITHFSSCCSHTLYYLTRDVPAYAIATLTYHLPCLSRWLWLCTVTADPLVQPAQVCVRRIPRSVSPYHPLLVYLTCVQHLLDCLFYMLCCVRPTKLCAYWHVVTGKWSQCKVMLRWKGIPGTQKLQVMKKTLILTMEMSCLSRVMNLMTTSVMFLAMSLSRGYFSFLLKISASVCCLGFFACTAWVNLLFNFKCFWFLYAVSYV